MTQTPPPLAEADLAALAALADAIIPPSAKYDVPGAGDPAIVAEIVSDAAKRMPKLVDALAALDALAEAEAGERFAALDPPARADVVAAFRDAHADAAALLANLAVQCYYRDARVMASLGLAPRPPHPEGYTVAQGDWSLLDPVRRRESFYRPAGR